jgi:hypothetical protein
MSDIPLGLCLICLSHTVDLLYSIPAIQLSTFDSKVIDGLTNQDARASTTAVEATGMTDSTYDAKHSSVAVTRHHCFDTSQLLTSTVDPTELQWQNQSFRREYLESPL